MRIKSALCAFRNHSNAHIQKLLAFYISYMCTNFDSGSMVRPCFHNVVKHMFSKKLRIHHKYLLFIDDVVWNISDWNFRSFVVCLRGNQPSLNLWLNNSSRNICSTVLKYSLDVSCRKRI